VVRIESLERRPEPREALLTPQQRARRRLGGGQLLVERRCVAVTGPLS
jgi:hypothetical protein